MFKRFLQSVVVMTMAIVGANASNIDMLNKDIPEWLASPDKFPGCVVAVAKAGEGYPQQAVLMSGAIEHGLIEKANVQSMKKTYVELVAGSNDSIKSNTIKISGRTTSLPLSVLEKWQRKNGELFALVCEDKATGLRLKESDVVFKYFDQTVKQKHDLITERQQTLLVDGYGQRKWKDSVGQELTKQSWKQEVDNKRGFKQLMHGSARVVGDQLIPAFLAARHKARVNLVIEESVNARAMLKELGIKTDNKADEPKTETNTKANKDAKVTKEITSEKLVGSAVKKVYYNKKEQIVYVLMNTSLDNTSALKASSDKTKALWEQFKEKKNNNEQTK